MKLLKQIGRLAPVLGRDAAGVAGIGLIAYGAWLVYPPAGFIAGGVELVAAAWLSARAQRSDA